MTRSAFVVVLAISTVLAGCEKLTTGIGSPAPVEGTYTLRSVNAVPMPARFEKSSREWFQFVSSDLTLKADSTFALEQVTSYSDDETVNPSNTTQRSAGTYREAGGVYWFRATGMQTEVAAEIKGRTLTFTVPGQYHTFVYQR